MTTTTTTKILHYYTATSLARARLSSTGFSAQWFVLMPLCLVVVAAVLG